MYSIATDVENTLIIKKSKFITNLYKINNINDVDRLLDFLRNEYKDATHICYAYIIGGIEKCFDDGEPSGTAGIPILNVLKKNNIGNILAVVVRYFGGIKLGAGGLVRAYSNSVVDALKLTNIVVLIDGYHIDIKFNYNNVKKIDLLLKNVNILSKSYDEEITYSFLITKEKFLLLEPELKSSCINIKIKENILISS